MILLTGGSGLLGQELQKHLECYAPSHSEFDITDFDSMGENLELKYDLVVHCAAYTDVVKAELSDDGKADCYETNVIGTRNVASLRMPIVYISTEYVFGGGRGNYKPYDFPNPVNFYALTKLLGEAMCEVAERYLIIRTVFKPRPFEHNKACTDQWTSGDYVDVIAPIIARAIADWRCSFGECSGEVIHIGTGRKSIYDLAKQSRPDVQPCLRSDIKSVKLPMDTSLTCEWKG